MSTQVRFPRYNSVPKVLSTRQGRCGEYAATLYQLVLSLGWQARWVVDWTDHVWVEVLVRPAEGEARGGAAGRPSLEVLRADLLGHGFL